MSPNGNIEYIESFEESAYFEPFIPLEEGDENRMPFPTGVLPSGLQEFVVASSEALQVPSDMMAMIALGMISVSINGKYHISVREGYIEPVNLYLLTIAEPSERKTAALALAKKPITDWVRRKNEDRKSEIQKYNDSIEFCKKKVQYLENKLIGKETEEVTSQLERTREELLSLETNPVSYMQLIADDCTPEKLAELMARNRERMSIVSAEGGLLDMLRGMYSKNGIVNIDVYTKGYSVEDYTVNRKGGTDIVLHSPTLTICVLGQREILRNFSSAKALVERGLFARFLFSIPKSMVGRRKIAPPPVSEMVSRGYGYTLTTLLEKECNKPEVLTLSVLAKEVEEEWEYQVEEYLGGEYRWMQAWLGKLVGQTLRIAGVLHCWKHPTAPTDYEVEEDTFRAAVEIAKYFLHHAEVAHRGASLCKSLEEEDAIYLWGILRRHKCETVKDLLNRAKKYEDREMYYDGINALSKHGYISVHLCTTEKGGRPTQRIFINPEALQVRC